MIEFKQKVLSLVHRWHCNTCGRSDVKGMISVMRALAHESVVHSVLCRSCYNRIKMARSRAARERSQALAIKRRVKKKLMRIWVMRCVNCSARVPVWPGITHNLRCKCGIVFSFKAVPVPGWRGLYAKKS